jgi:hypothetical protein
MTHKNYAFLIPKTRPRINLFPRFVIQHSDIDLAHIPLIGELHSRSLHQVGLFISFNFGNTVGVITLFSLFCISLFLKTI